MQSQLSKQFKKTRRSNQKRRSMHATRKRFEDSPARMPRVPNTWMTLSILAALTFRATGTPRAPHVRFQGGKADVFFLHCLSVSIALSEVSYFARPKAASHCFQALRFFIESVNF